MARFRFESAEIRTADGRTIPLGAGTVKVGNEPMTEAEWLASDDARRMLDHLLRRNEAGTISSEKNLARNGITNRKLRLLACAGGRILACEKNNFSGMSPQEREEYIAGWEAYADGGAAPRLRHAGCYLESRDAVHQAEYFVSLYPIAIAQAETAALFRDIFGNPWQKKPRTGDWSQPNPRYGSPVWICYQPWRTWLQWNERTIPRLAESIYEQRAWDRLPILADALEEAGCTEESLIAHCRSAGPHVRGCWALDVLLGKE